MLEIDEGPGRTLKRAIDVLGALAGLVGLAPVFMLVGVLIKLDSPGPVFFRQLRIGRHEVPFIIWKFRTMAADGEGPGPRVTVGADPRVTQVGWFLRRWKIDELPQFLNVLQGTMSLVGPRPELSHYVDLYSSQERRVLHAKPGITDPASIRYRNEEETLGAVADPDRYYREVVMREKLAINLDYSGRATVFSDLGVILRTLTAIALGRGRPKSGSW